MTPEELLELTLGHANRISPDPLDEDLAREAARRALDAAVVKPRRRPRIMIAAAAVALLGLFGGLGLAFLGPSAAVPVMASKDAPQEVLDTADATPEGAVVAQQDTSHDEAPAERVDAVEAAADVRLPSGDRLLSDSGTHYEVVSTDADRVVALTEGDVLFDIESIEGGSFVVDAGDTQVRVLGTVFSVRRTEIGIAVLVYEGRVEVSDESGERILGAGEIWASHATLLDDEWRDASEARWNAIIGESANELDVPPSDEPTVRAEPQAARALLLRRQYAQVLEAALSELDEDDSSAMWTMIAADAYRGLQNWEAAARHYRRATTLLRDSRRAQMGYAAAQIYADRLNRPHLALICLADGRSAQSDSIVEERARSLQIRLYEDTGAHEELSVAVDAYLERFPDTYTARRLRAGQ